jgi:photosystem II stability/assembly factor-like uncharacterized protein
VSDDDLDIEHLLRTTLSERARQAPSGAGLAEQIIAEADHPHPIRDGRGPRRWRGWTLPAVAAGSVAAVVAVVIGLAQVHQSHKDAADHRASATTHPRSTGGATAHFSGESSGSAVPSASTSEPMSSPSVGLPGGAVGPHFHAIDLTFDGNQDGWALGTSGCLNGQPGTCSTIVHSGDGGASWTSSIQIPPVPIAHECGASPCVTSLRFANADVGYAFGPGALFMTTDGGLSWGDNQGDTSSLEVADGTALRISSGVLQIADVGSRDWQPAAVPATDQYVSQLVRSSNYAYAESVSKKATNAGTVSQTVLASTDDGKQWAERANPCDQVKPASDIGQLAAGADGSLTLLCQGRTATKPDAPARFVVTSTDGGVSFSTPVALPAASGAFSLAAASASVLFYVDDKLHRSTNGGQSWAVVETDPTTAQVSARGQQPAAFLGFESPSTGRWVTGDGSMIWTTTDAGATWNPCVFK